MLTINLKKKLAFVVAAVLLGGALPIAATATADAAPAPLNLQTQCGNVSRGQVNGCVTTLQTQLNQLGFGAGTVDGNFGANTQAAVKRLQAAAKLTQDGIVGPATKAALQVGSVGTVICGYRVAGAIGIYIWANPTKTGCPTGTQYAFAGGQRQNTTGGAVLWSTDTALTGAHIVTGQIGAYILTHNTGFPINDQYAWAGGLRQDTSNDRMVLLSSDTAYSGAHLVYGPIREFMLKNPYTGFPTEDQHSVLGMFEQQKTSFGTLSYTTWPSVGPVSFQHK